MISAHESASGNGSCTSGFNQSPLAAVDAADYSLRPSTASCKGEKCAQMRLVDILLTAMEPAAGALRFGNRNLRAG